MKRLIPMWIATVAGFVMIVAFFIPVTQHWSEKAAIWFDILQAIAFILGGGNLLKIHLKKVSDKPAGWGYSAVVLVSFLVMLGIGLLKIGVPPAPKQEFYGETFAKLSLDSIPDKLVFSEKGTIPEKASGEKMHPSVRWQISEADGAVQFRGWMRPGQKEKLLAHKDVLSWKCSIETLFDTSQPQGELAGRVAYYADHRVLSFTGNMTEAHREALLALEGDENWEAAVADLYDRTQGTTSITVGAVPPLFDRENLPRDVLYDDSMLSVVGPMGGVQHGALLDMFPLARPMSAADRTAVLNQLRAAGPVASEQEVAFHKILDGSWTVEQLHRVLDEAGEAQEVDKTACEMFAEQQEGAEQIDPKKLVGTDVTLNNRQVAALESFAEDESMTIDALVGRLKPPGDFTSAQESALRKFLGTIPTRGERNKALCFGMMKVEGPDGRALPLNADQRDLLLADYRAQEAWRRTARRLYVSAHVVKFPWAGDFAAQGSPFWWLYEYMFKPLQATIFAMLAFYVASAAFRAFRAKNTEAILLLSTAFIILLGRTFAGVWLTDWISDDGPFRGLRIENLTVYIMQVFNTAGNRAIMIGIALGIASTSLKVLLGVDRSYLGSAAE